MNGSANTINVDKPLDVINQVVAVLNTHGAMIELALAICGGVLLASLAVAFALFLASKL